MNKNYINRIFYFTIGIPILIVTLYLIFAEKQIKLDSNQIHYLFSTSAQTIAGLFGLSITGFIFLRNHLDKKVQEDDSFRDVVEALNKKNFYTVIFMSTLAILTIILSLFMIISEEYKSFFHILMLNYTLILIFNEISLIICFGCAMIEPKKLEKLSDKLKKEFEQNRTKSDEKNGVLDEGDFTAFMRAFNEIEKLLHYLIKKTDMRTGHNYKDVTYSNFDYGKNISNRQIVDYLLRRELINKKLQKELVEVIQYRNYLVHSSEIKTDKRMEEKVEWLKDTLKIIIEREAKGGSMSSTGEKPGKGKYICTKCFTCITLDDDDAILPPCPKCSNTTYF